MLHSYEISQFSLLSNFTSNRNRNYIILSSRKITNSSPFFKEIKEREIRKKERKKNHASHLNEDKPKIFCMKPG